MAPPPHVAGEAHREFPARPGDKLGPTHDESKPRDDEDSRCGRIGAGPLRAQLAGVTGGLAPDVYVNAWWDWYLNLAKEPPKQAADPAGCVGQGGRQLDFRACGRPAGKPLPPAEGDARYGGEAWSQWPFNVYARSYRNYVDWWQKRLVECSGRRPGE